MTNTTTSPPWSLLHAFYSSQLFLARTVDVSRTPTTKTAFGCDSLPVLSRANGLDNAPEFSFLLHAPWACKDDVTNTIHTPSVLTSTHTDAQRGELLSTSFFICTANGTPHLVKRRGSTFTREKQARALSFSLSLEAQTF